MNNSTKNNIDEEILALIADNKIEGWQLLYDKYATMIYGIICNIANNKTVAEDIFCETFIKLKKSNIVLNTDVSICIYLAKYTYTFAKERLQQKGLLNSKTNNQDKFLNQFINKKEYYKTAKSN